MIKFRSVLGRYEASEFNQLEAAELLGVSERIFRRWCLRFEDAGEAGLLDRRLGRASGKRVPIDREQEVEALYRSRYSGFTAKHFHEHLIRDHNFNWGYTWTKVFLQSKGLLERAKQRGAHRRKRPRRPLPGMMLHQSLPPDSYGGFVVKGILRRRSPFLMAGRGSVRRVGIACSILGGPIGSDLSVCKLVSGGT